MSEKENMLNKQEPSSSALKPSSNRRKFFKKAALGAAITTIPSHSVWAGRLVSGNMSGNVSGWADCNELAIYSHGKFKSPNNGNGNGSIPLNTIQSNVGLLSAVKWSDVFNGAPLSGASAYDNDLLQTFLDNENTHKAINCQLIAMYINAVLDVNGNQEGVKWPVVGGLFNSAEEYANDLYNQAIGNEGKVATALGKIIDEHHVATGLKQTCSPVV